VSIIEDEAVNYWSGSRGNTEWSYFEMGFDKAVELVGSCMECEYLYDIENCPLDVELMKDVSKNSFYCASFDEKKANTINKAHQIIGDI